VEALVKFLEERLIALGRKETQVNAEVQESNKTGNLKMKLKKNLLRKMKIQRLGVFLDSLPGPSST
jgi:hypothetical protein